MNERIRELHGQAYLYALHNETKAREGGCHEPGTFNNDYREKFAELIVQECAKIANSQFEAATGLNDRDSWTAAEMKKHFGVAE